MSSNSLVGKTNLLPGANGKGGFSGSFGSINDNLFKGNVGQAWSQSFGNEGLGGWISTGLGLGAPKDAKLEDAGGGSSTPTLAQTNTTAIQNQLMDEQNSFMTSSLLTGGRGATTQAQTTSSMLLGS